MGETRTIFDPFAGKMVEIRNDLVLRLRGRYANGPTMPNGEPEFGWREFETPPIQHEAATEIDLLRTVIFNTINDLNKKKPNIGAMRRYLTTVYNARVHASGPHPSQNQRDTSHD